MKEGMASKIKERRAYFGNGVNKGKENQKQIERKNEGQRKKTDKGKERSAIRYKGSVEPRKEEKWTRERKEEKVKTEKVDRENV